MVGGPQSAGRYTAPQAAKVHAADKRNMLLIWLQTLVQLVNS